ncbi:MAG: PAS domain S-box protein [Anaerolineales bacterium]|nr:PAS domain S-box protein [Anaerolineales bacterium]
MSWSTRHSQKCSATHHLKKFGKKVKNVSTDIFADPQRRLEIIRLRIENPELNTFENLYQRKDGSTFIGRLHIHTIKYVTGNEIFEGFIEDISEYKRAEEALKTALNFSNDLINSMQDGVSVLDKNGVHLDVNTALCRMTGFSREEIIGTETPHPYWPEEEYEHIQSAFQQTFENPAATFELIFKRKNGARFPVIVSPFAIKDELGNIVSYSATVKDISERKQAEIRLRRFWDLPLVGMAITSPARRFIEVNQKLADMFGYTTQELVGMTWVELTHPEDVDRNIQLLEEVIAGKSDQYELDKRFIRRDGTLLYTHIAAHCVRDTNGAVNYMVLLIQDVTETKQADQKLQKIKNLLSETEIIGHVGGWELNIDTKEQTWTEEIYRIHELDLSLSTDCGRSHQFLCAHIQTDHRERRTARIRERRTI